MAYQVTVDYLSSAASENANKATTNSEADATDRVAIAVYEVGAALTERLERLIKLLEQAKPT